MINSEQIAEILSLYRKHGWSLRRVLLSEKLKKNLADGVLEQLFNGAEIVSDEIDAAWFSRPSRGRTEAWELSLLSENRFALLEMFDAEDDEEICREARSEMELRMKNR